MLPLRDIDHDLAFSLLYHAREMWDTSDRTDVSIACVWPLLRSICLMTPTAIGLEWRLEKLETEYETIKNLFLIEDAAFFKLHEFEPLEMQTPKDEFSPAPPSSGNSSADRIASFLHNTDWGPEQIKTLLGWLSREELSKVLWSLSEYAYPDQRLEAEKARLLEESGYDLESLSLGLAMGAIDVNELTGERE